MLYMRELFISYFASIVYPFRVHDYFRFKIPLPEPDWAYPRELNIFEAICVSWVFELVKAIIQVLLINITLIGVTSYHQEASSYIGSFPMFAAFSSHSFFLLAIGIRVVLFPIISLISYEFWSIVLRFVGHMMETPGQLHQIAERIIVSSQSSHLFSVVPIVGDFAQKIASMFLMFAGIRKHLQTSTLLSIIILFIPVFLIIGIVGFLSVSFVLFFI